MKTILCALVLMALVDQILFAQDLRTVESHIYGHPRVVGTTVQTADGTMWVRWVQMNNIVVAITGVPKDLVLVDGTSVTVQIKRGTVKAAQLKDKDGRVHTFITMEARLPPSLNRH